MKIISSKSNIMCGGCVAKVTQLLDELAGSSNWKPGLLQPRRILSVNTGTLENSEIISP